MNADDFGRSHGINRGVVEAHACGIVTSASLMVRWPAAGEAIEYCRAHPALSLGIHLDLGEWICDNGEWTPRYAVVATDDATAIAAEFARQISIFEDRMGAAPTHIDSHQHVHLRSPARSAAIAAAARIGVPLRQCANGIRYCGDFHGQSINGITLPESIGVQALIRLLRQLPDGVTELACHPGFASDVDTAYRDERTSEVHALCSPLVRGVVASERIELVSFANLGPGEWAPMADDQPAQV